MKQLRLVVEKNCCGNIAGCKPKNSELCRRLVYFLREVCTLALSIVMSLQYLFETSTNNDKTRKKIEAYIICRASQPIWSFGDLSSGLLTEKIRARPHRLKSINKTEKSYQAETAQQTLCNSCGMETLLPICALNG